MYFPAADTLALSTNGSERVKIDTAGITKFRGTGAAYDSTPGDGVSDALYLQVDSAGIAHIDSYAGGGSTNLSFGTNSGGGAVVEKMRLNATGAVVLAGGSTSANGTGITFPATQSASTDVNTLDDYEEGTFTPSVGGTATYTEQLGQYVKIGRQVTVFVAITINVIGTGSAQQISGLPFVGSMTAPGQGGGPTYWQGLSSAAVYVSLRVDNGTSYLQLGGATAAVVTSSAGFNCLTTGSRLIATATYTAS